METDAPPFTPAADCRTGEPRRDGWTPQKQAEFLLALATFGIVEEACKTAGMSVTSAYLLRNARRGTAFALGWKAAHLIARDRLSDDLLKHAIRGIETVTIRDDIESVRRGISPLLSMAVVNRLDRFAAARDDREAAVARAIASDFDAFIDLILDGGDDAAVRAFLADHPDPYAAIEPAPPASAATSLESPKLVEKTAILEAARPVAANDQAGPAIPIACSCPADRGEMALESA